MVERIKKIIADRKMTLSLFANATNIHPTTLSHIINGREMDGKGKINQTPSTDVIMKILSTFPDVSAEWLMMGAGPMYKGQRTLIQPDLFSKPVPKSPSIPEFTNHQQEMEERPEEKETKIPQKQLFMPELSLSDNIDKIVIFFKNKTYVTLKPEI